MIGRRVILVAALLLSAIASGDVPNSMVSACGGAADPLGCVDRLYAADARNREKAEAAKKILAARMSAEERARREQAERTRRANLTPAQRAAEDAALQKKYDDLMKAEALRTAEPKAPTSCSCNGMSVTGSLDANDPTASCRANAIASPAFAAKIRLSGVCPRSYNSDAQFQLKCSVDGAPSTTVYSSCSAKFYSPAVTREMAGTGTGTTTSTPSGQFYKP